MKFIRRLVIGILVAVAGLYLLTVVLYAIPVASGALDETMEVKFARPDPSLVADFGNGLTAEQKQTLYHMSQGSEILPWILFTAVDVADPGSTKPFVDNLERYGLLPDPGRDGLPVGLTVSSNPFTFGMDFVGVNCAACHVSELRHGNKAIRVDGATNMFNLQLFYSDAIEAVIATTSDRGKLWHALKRLGRQDYQRYGISAPFVRPATLLYSGALVLLHRDRLDARLELIKVIEAAKEQRDPQHPTSGFGRLDAFDGTRNFIFTRLRKADASGDFSVNRANMVKLDAPVKFPWLWSKKASPPPPIEVVRQHPESFPLVWGFKDFDWIEWTINTNTVMERNFTETLGAGSTVVLDPKSGSLFESSIPIRNLHELELVAYYLDPPRWPVAIFGDIKPDLAATGERIFQSQCARCHEYGQDRRTPTGLLRLRGMTPDGAGTDSVVALKISCPVPDIGALSVQPRSYSAEEATILKDCAGVSAGKAFSGNSFARTVQTAVDGIKQKAFAAASVDAALQKSMEDTNRRGPDKWRDTLLDTQPPEGPYAARPLYGIWAAAPYLHNGSVPTLYHLLLPPEQRPRTFALGNREYDPAKLGFVVDTACRQQDCLVDTRRTGDGNGGHLWGTDLAEPDRMALLEYLKTY
jgi:hypothetical protein